MYRLADGWINITVARQHEWAALCQALRLPALAGNARFATVEDRIENAEALRDLLRSVLMDRRFEKLSERLAAHRVMHERLNTYTEFLNQPHVPASGAIGWVTHPAVPGKLPLPNVIGAAPFRDGEPRARAPALGEHGEAILREHGYSPAAIEALRARRTVRG